jgi:hypothetical protein
MVGRGEGPAAGTPKSNARACGRQCLSHCVHKSLNQSRPPAPAPPSTTPIKGLKFFTAKGGLEKADIAAILASAAEMCRDAGVTLSERRGAGAGAGSGQ